MRRRQALQALSSVRNQAVGAKQKVDTLNVSGLRSHFNKGALRLALFAMKSQAFVRMEAHLSDPERDTSASRRQERATAAEE